MFKFDLWPMSDIAAWEHDGQAYIHWFGLTDGWYTIDCGGTELLRYNQRLIDATPQWNWRTPYFDYHVVRLYEDVLDVLPQAIDPIPSDVLDLVRSTQLERSFRERSLHWADHHWSAPDPARFNQRVAFWKRAAGWWLEDRRLSRGHMAGQPDIQLWSENDILTVRWINDCKVAGDTGLLWNEVGSGEYTMPTADFVGEVKSFHDRLMNAMRGRVELATSDWPRADVAVDADALRQEQEKRMGSLARALDYAANRRCDWNAVREAIREVARAVGD